MKSNYYTRETILFEGPKSGPITELREDSGRLVLYLESWQMLEHFRHFKGLIFKSQFTKNFTGELSPCSVDLHFPMSEEMALLKGLGEWFSQDKTALDGHTAPSGRPAYG